MAPHRLLTSLFLGALALSLLACPSRRDVERVGEADSPLILILSPDHSMEEAPGVTAERAHAMRQRLAAFLSEHAELAVEVRVSPTSDAAVTSVGAALGDAWLVPLFSYLFAEREYGAEAALQVVRGEDRREYVGEILVHADSDIRQLADLGGKRIAYVDPQSTAGFLLPAALLEDAGVNARHEFAGSHPEALARLLAGEVDAAAVYAGVDRDDPRVRVLAETAAVPHEPLFFRQSLPEDVRERLVSSLLAFAESTEGREILGHMADITGFVPVDDALRERYQEVSQVLHRAGRQLEDLVPRGWLIHNLNQMSPADFLH